MRPAASLPEGVELVPQAAHLHVDGAVEGVGRAPPRPVEELVAGEHPLGPRDEAVEEVVLGAGERDLGAGSPVVTVRAARFTLRSATMSVPDPASAAGAPAAAARRRTARMRARRTRGLNGFET